MGDWVSARLACWRWPGWPPRWSCRRSADRDPPGGRPAAPAGLPAAGPALLADQARYLGTTFAPSTVRRFNGYGLLGRGVVGLALEEGGLRVDRDRDPGASRPATCAGSRSPRTTPARRSTPTRCWWSTGGSARPPALGVRARRADRPRLGGAAGAAGAPMTARRDALLVLEDGTAFAGEAFTARRPRSPGRWCSTPPWAATRRS